MANSMNPNVSVIIATYNVATYIERAVRSALDQQGIELEVILIDDCSTDETVSVAAHINDPRIKILRLAANSGPSVARNYGIQQATGDWISILDGDDAFAPGRLKRCIELAVSKNADIVVDNLEVHSEVDGTQYSMFTPKDFNNKTILDLSTFIKGNSSFLGGISLGYVKPIFSAEFLRRTKLSYAPDIHIGEDYMLLAESLACGAICAVEMSAGYFYTVRKGSISHRLRIADIERIQAIDKMFLGKYKIDQLSYRAQKIRNSSLQQAFFYTALADAIKKHLLLKVLAIAVIHPTSILPLWRPVWSRIIKPFIETTNMISRSES